MEIYKLSEVQLKKKFTDYLIANGYSAVTPTGLPSTAYNYPIRIDKIVYYENYKNWFDVIANINKLLIDYDIGGIKEKKGNISHRAVINALKRFNEFLISLKTSY